MSGPDNLGGDDDGDERLAGTKGEISAATRRAGGAVADLIGASYLFVFDRSPREKAVVSVVTFLAGALAGPAVKRATVGLISEILRLTPRPGAVSSGELALLLDTLIAVMLLTTSVFVSYKLNRMDGKLESVTKIRTDGGRGERHVKSPDDGQRDDESLGTGEGAIVGLVMGAAIGGVPAVIVSPVWIVVGMIIGAMIGDELEKMGKRSVIADR